MHLTPEQRKLRDEERRRDAEVAMAEHRESEKAFYDNFERLKAERLAREARAGGK
ncbi:hypothetical protein JQ604_40055 [Bradyrhizobium jicamae]|uniref:hypothetical protein n=1 Tax=Bradyrhizobium jicamae TaxID=280332 RepID=UPI001BAA350A|nr:hypothetical protein [Bradyrhizobium jicamae]MBR0758410.1 hypothetical protein [Bradyrhizobium jicamae]